MTSLSSFTKRVQVGPPTNSIVPGCGRPLVVSQMPLPAYGVSSKFAPPAAHWAYSGCSGLFVYLESLRSVPSKPTKDCIRALASMPWKSMPPPCVHPVPNNLQSRDVCPRRSNSSTLAESQRVP
jgi:hypothetical protein